MAPQPKTGRSLSDFNFTNHFSKLKTTVYPEPAPTRHSLSTFASGGPPIKSLAWSPLGNFIAVGGTNRPGTLRVWNPERPQIKYSTELKTKLDPSEAKGRVGLNESKGAHLTQIECVAWNPMREAELASLGNDGVVKFWDVRSRGEVGEYRPEPSDGGYSVCWRPDGSEIVIGTKVRQTGAEAGFMDLG
jgi:THO complex subunit 3